MDDAMKAGGAVAGAGVGGAILLLAWRVYNDDALTRFVVVFGMLAFVLMMLALGFVLYRQAAEARRYQVDTNLTQARVIRTLDGVGQVNRPALPGGDMAALMSALMGGAPAGEVVNAQVREIEGGDDD